MHGSLVAVPGFVEAQKPLLCQCMFCYICTVCRATLQTAHGASTVASQALRPEAPERLSGAPGVNLPCSRRVRWRQAGLQNMAANSADSGPAGAAEAFAGLVFARA